MTSQKISYTKQLTYSAVLLATGVTLNSMLPNAANLKMGMGGPFISFVGILFGPLWGGIAGALTDIICHFLNPLGDFNPVFTIVAFCKAFSIATLYRFMQKTKGFSYRKLFIAPFAIIIAWSALSLIAMHQFPGSAYGLYVSGLTIEIFNKTKTSIPLVLLVVGLVGLGLYLVTQFTFARKGRPQLEKHLYLLPVVGIPCLVFTTVNTLLIFWLYFKTKTMPVFWGLYIPRLAEEIVQILYSTYILAVLVHTYETKIRKGNH